MVVFVALLLLQLLLLLVKMQHPIHKHHFRLKSLHLFCVNSQWSFVVNAMESTCMYLSDTYSDTRSLTRH